MPVNYFHSFLFSVVLLFSSTLYANMNVLINPGFETGDTTGWHGRSCSIETVTSPVPHSGSYCARAYNRTDTWQGIQQDVKDAMAEGETYLVSGWVRTSSPDSADIRISFEQQDDDGTDWHWAATGTADNSGWVQLTGSFTLDVNGILSGLYVYFEGPDASVDIYVDDVNVYGPEPGPIEPNATGYIDASIRHQEIEGFGASGAWYTSNLLDHPDCNDLIDILFNQLGLDIYRIRNTYQIEQGTFDESVEIATRGEASLGRDLKIMISSWSPPADLKSNGRTNQGGTLRKDTGGYIYGEFADWWYDSVAAYLAAGIEADYISIQNECDYEATWDSCKFEPVATPNYAGYDAAFEAVWNKLDSEMGSAMPKMLGPETSGFERVGYYINNLVDFSHVYGYAHHLYNCYGDGDSAPGCGSAPDMYLGIMAHFQGTYGHKPIFQTEYEYEATSFENAMNTALLLHNSLTVEEVVSYLYWDLFWGGSSGLVSISSPSYTINPVYYAFKHYSAFIHSGWQRIEAESDNPGLRISAYISPDSNNLTCVLINTAPDTNIETHLHFIDFPIADGNVYRTSQTENCEFVGNFNGAEPLILPAESITTLSLSLSLLANIPPVANAGPDQTAYAFINGYATVNLNGSGSYDDDGDPLSYYWSWNINSTDYQTNGVSPTIQLPIGQHTIELVVDDGTEESQPDYCTINVIAPVEARLLCIPIFLKKRVNHGRLTTTITMPPGIHKSDIDINDLPVMYPYKIVSDSQRVYGTHNCRKSCTRIRAFFRKSVCAKHLKQGMNEITVMGRLTSGQYYKATGYLWLVEKRRNLPRNFNKWRRRYKRWFRWKTNDF